MQATELSSAGLKKQYKIVVDKARIQAQTEIELKAAGEQVKIPGFRPGFIPMKILQQRYGKAVQSDVLKQVINQATNEFISEKNFRPTMTPEVNIESFEEDADLAFTISFEVFPDMPDVDFTKIKLSRKVYEISDQDIDKTMTTIAERNPKLVRASEGSKAALGNVVNIDFRGSVAGVEFKGGTATNFQLELGSNQFIDGFEKQLVGVKEGDERTVTVTFPVEYPAADLAGKEADFAVKVHEILAKEPAEIDDTFVKEKGFADVAAFREAVRGQMAKEYDQIVRNQLKKELFDILESEHKLELPQGMVDLEFNSIWQRLQEAKQQGDESIIGKSDDELKTEYMDIAKRRVKLGLMLAEVGTRNKIQITREELTRAIMQQASQYPGQESKVIDFYRKNPERAEELRGPILEEKAVDFVLSKVTFNDQKVALDDLVDEDEDESGETSGKSKGGKAKSAKKSGDAEAEEKSASKKKAAK
jgi:trigger factor